VPCPLAHRWGSLRNAPSRVLPAPPPDQNPGWGPAGLGRRCLGGRWTDRAEHPPVMLFAPSAHAALSGAQPLPAHDNRGHSSTSPAIWGIFRLSGRPGGDAEDAITSLLGTGAGERNRDVLPRRMLSSPVARNLQRRQMRRTMGSDWRGRQLRSRGEVGRQGDGPLPRPQQSAEPAEDTQEGQDPRRPIHSQPHPTHWGRHDGATSPVPLWLPISSGPSASVSISVIWSHAGPGKGSVGLSKCVLSFLSPLCSLLIHSGID
jgi:hypothetical protein